MTLPDWSPRPSRPSPGPASGAPPGPASGPIVEGAACSVLSARAGESAYGTAPDATSWVCLEQNGPWGRQAAAESRLDPALGRRLDEALRAAGGRFALIRRPGAHPDTEGERERPRVLVAHVIGTGWLLSGQVSPSELAGLDVAALARGDQAAVRRSLPALRPDPAATLLICTNGRRDVCCAVRGRPVAAGAAAACPGQVWETSHTAGHRFAPTGVLLPSGVMLARLDVPLAVQALQGAGRGELTPALHGPQHDRGASGLPGPQRAAVSAVRRVCAEPSLAALSVASAQRVDEATWGIVVRHADERIWQATVVRAVLGPDLPQSCAKPAVPQVGWSVTVDEATLVTLDEPT